MFEYFSHNGVLQPAASAVVPLDNIAYAYGFGVYETIRVTNGVTYFLEDHTERLLRSAAIIDLVHNFTAASVGEAVTVLVAANQAQSCNIKILLIGGKAAGDANLYIQCLQPLFPNRKLYKQGVHTITDHMERAYPHAKTLNMLPSYLAYRKAQQAEAYDCLLIDRHAAITEGTRTNFYAVSGNEIVSPPLKDILPGVTRDNVLRVARNEGFTLSEHPIARADIQDFDGAFLTSTSSRIMPIRSIDDFVWPTIPESTQRLMQAFTAFLSDYATTHH